MIARAFSILYCVAFLARWIASASFSSAPLHIVSSVDLPKASELVFAAQVQISNLYNVLSRDIAGCSAVNQLKSGSFGSATAAVLRWEFSLRRGEDTQDSALRCGFETPNAP